MPVLSTVEGFQSLKTFKKEKTYHRDTEIAARLRRNQNEKSRIHHEGMVRRRSPQAPDRKVFVGCASRTGRSRNISRKDAKSQRKSIVISNTSTKLRTSSERNIS